MFNQYKIVKSLPVTEGVQSRGDCPFCKGKNTFTWTKSSGNLKWKCFRASCEAHGVKQIGYAIRDVVSIFNKKKEEQTVWQHPASWTEITSVEEAYLRRFNIYSFIDKEFIKHDIKQNRLCFITDKKAGAVGRSIVDKKKPKWYNYGDVSGGILVHVNYTKLILVEDCISAFVVSRFASAITILGTQLTDKHIIRIKNYDHVIIVLDPDARKKALSMVKELTPYTRTSIYFVKDDPKYLSDKELKHVCL